MDSPHTRTRGAIPGYGDANHGRPHSEMDGAQCTANAVVGGAVARPIEAWIRSTADRRSGQFAASDSMIEG
ncbi:hypothetical protein OG225_00420 [Nocardia sp. NBC_01377]